MWLCISSVFRDSGSYTAVTKTVVQHAPSAIPSLDLPIPQDTLGKRSPSIDGSIPYTAEQSTCSLPS
ncbi:hypothetical protein QBC34DRAFT_395851 [Podospora aff. communis PSN243]|uniref:Uncharacterized protein n=1 Tax=Podospora aff. communis PSN243 TaxID=3040156 RepID=A0AAV9GZM4_9PEZI|nr:hypothetical protein QBC34DRAFT_395851 [Podospora aff. communis PSN243]